MTLTKILFTLTFITTSIHLHASELTDYLNSLHTFQSNFTQTVFSPNNQTKQKSEGIIIVKSPDKFYLEYNEPYKLLYVADGKKLWSYDEDLEQVVVKEQGNLLINTPAMLLGNPKQLANAYIIESTGQLDGLNWYELTPKADSGNFEKVSLGFSDGKLAAMEMQDNFGQTTRLNFNNVLKNTKVDTSRFKFVPPKDVDVIGQ